MENTQKKNDPGHKTNQLPPHDLSALWAEINKEQSFFSQIVKFITHPFFLLGGVVVALYFMNRREKSSVSDIDLRDKNNALLAEVKALRKENKKLISRLGKTPKGQKQLDRPKDLLTIPVDAQSVSTIYLD